MFWTRNRKTPHPKPPTPPPPHPNHSWLVTTSVCDFVPGECAFKCGVRTFHSFVMPYVRYISIPVVGDTNLHTGWRIIGSRTRCACLGRWRCVDVTSMVRASVRLCVASCGLVRSSSTECAYRTARMVYLDLADIESGRDETQDRICSLAYVWFVCDKYGRMLDDDECFITWNRNGLSIIIQIVDMVYGNIVILSVDYERAHVLRMERLMDCNI